MQAEQKNGATYIFILSNTNLLLKRVDSAILFSLKKRLGKVIIPGWLCRVMVDSIVNLPFGLLASSSFG